MWNLKVGESEALPMCQLLGSIDDGRRRHPGTWRNRAAHSPPLAGRLRNGSVSAATCKSREAAEEAEGDNARDIHAVFVFDASYPHAFNGNIGQSDTPHSRALLGTGSVLIAAPRARSAARSEAAYGIEPVSAADYYASKMSNNHW